MNKPSLQQLIDRAKSTLVNKLGVANPAIDAMAAMVAGASYGQYAYQDYLFQQLNPETAFEPWLYLWASRFDVPRLAAQQAFGTVNFERSGEPVNVPAGIVLKTQDDKEYETTESGQSDQPIPVKSIDGGEQFNLLAGVKLTMTAAVAGLDPDEITTNTIDGGADIEELERWRERIVDAFNSRQAVGRLEDYEMWARSAHQDVDYAWGFDNTPDTGFVTLYIGQQESDPAVSDAVKAVVENYIEEQRLAGCHIYVHHPVAKPISVTISGVDDINTRDQLTAALEYYILSRMGDQEPITPGQIVLSMTSVTTDFSIVSPTQTTNIEDNEVFTFGGVTWL